MIDIPFHRRSLEFQFQTLNVNSGRKCTNEDSGPISVWGTLIMLKKKNINIT